MSQVLCSSRQVVVYDCRSILSEKTWVVFLAKKIKCYLYTLCWLLSVCFFKKKKVELATYQISGNIV